MSVRLRSWLLATLVVVTGTRAFATSPPEIVCGETLVGLLASGPVEIPFRARAGEVVSATVVPLVPLPGFEPRWRIADVESNPVGLSNGMHRCVGRCQTDPLPSGQTFTLRVSDSGLGTGAYVVSFEAVSATANGVSNGPPTPTCARTRDGEPDGTRAIVSGEELAGAIDGPGETDTFTLDAQAGEVVHVSLARTGGDDAFAPRWDAFGADGGRLVGSAADATAPVGVDGVVTILVDDGSLRARGTYTIAVGHEPPPTTTSTTVASPTTTTGDDGTTTTTTSAESSTSTTTLETSTTTTATEPTTSTTGPDVGSTTTSTAVPPTSSTTVTVPGSSTTTLAPELDLETVIHEPAIGPRGTLGRALAVAKGRLLIGAPHEDVGTETDRIRDAGALLVVDVAGAPPSPTFGQVFRLARPDGPVSHDAFAAAVAPAGAGAVVGAPGARRAFVFADVQQTAATTLVPPDAPTDDEFGAAVAWAAGFAVVGAPNDGAGAVHVFASATGTAFAVLTPPAGAPAARFGAALAASGSLVLVGAPGGPGVAGRAFLFDAAAGTLLQTFVARMPAGGDEFGAAVAFDGDAPVIGVPGADGGRGRVDRFDPTTGKSMRSWVSPSPVAGERFGTSIAVADGILVVGAPGAVLDGNTTGAAYVFDAAAGTLTTTLHKAMPQLDDEFGTAVATAGGRVFVGAPGDDGGTTDGGMAYVFDGDTIIAALRERLSVDGFGASAAANGGTVWIGSPAGAGGIGFVSRLDQSGSEPGPSILSPETRPTRFGAAVAALGSTIVVGAPEADAGSDARVGTVFLFDDRGQQQSRIENPSHGAGDEFGFAVATLDGDVLASAPFAGPNDTGLVYRLSAGKPRATYGKAVPTAGDFFGAALAADGGQVLVGAPLDASGGSPTGAVYLFDADSAAVVHAIVNPNEAPDLFGASVALGGWLVVGAPLASDGIDAVGTVWVFDRATGALVRKLQNPRAHTDDAFGAAVALFGDVLAVGAPRADDTVPDAGLVHLFDAGTGQLLQTLRNPPQGAFDHFGFTLAPAGSGLLVGSPGPSRVYVFDPIAPAAGVVRAASVAPAARAVAAAAVGASCGNGLVEGTEQCDDGNAIDTDDCRNDCTRGPCCTLDPVASAPRCDDGDRCTTDVLDPVLGCRYEPSGEPGCCQDDADCPDGGVCRVCVGCFIYRWDCCGTPSRCVAPVDPACAGKTCVDAASCECEGKLACDDEPVPDALRVPFVSACAVLRQQASIAPDGTLDKPELVLARQRTRNARGSLRKTIHLARVLGRGHQISTACRKQLVQQVRAVRKAIPRGKRLRRCLVSGG